MRYDFIRRGLVLVLVSIIALLCGITAFAEDLDGDGIDDGELATEYVTEFVEPETIAEPETQYEPITEAPIVTESETVPEVHTDAPTEPVEPQTENNQPTNYYEPETMPHIEGISTQHQGPTLDKIISTKTYTTNNIAGIVSWVCVGLGVIVVAVVLISTKASGRRQR